MGHELHSKERKNGGAGKERKGREKRERKDRKDHTAPHVVRIELFHEILVPLYMCMLHCSEKMSFLLWVVVPTGNLISLKLNSHQENKK